MNEGNAYRGIQPPDGQAYPKNISVTDNPEAFYDSVMRWNQIRLEAVSLVLEKKLTRFKHYAVAIVGSDSRLEKGPYSPFEFIVISSCKETAEAVRKVILNNSCEHGSPYTTRISHKIPVTDKRIETKIVHSAEHKLSYYQNNKRHVWPDRILSARFLCGDESIFLDAQAQVIDETIKDNRIRRKVVEEIKKRRSIVTKGRVTQSSNPHIDLETGRVFMDPDEYRMATKSGHMRLIQLTLTVMQIDAERAHLDPNVISRINEVGAIAQETGQAYMQAMLWYHLAQELYVDKKQSLHFEVDDELLHYISTVIYQFSLRGDDDYNSMIDQL